jgi:hypothetical protein
MRNLRWTDCLHHLLDVVLSLDIDDAKKKKVFAILAKQEATAAGQTIPSYRIPLLWEALFLEIREALSQGIVDGGNSSCFENTSGASKTASEAASTKVVIRHTKPRRTSNIQK